MKAALFLVLASVGIESIHAAPFQNLGFDEAITNNVTPLNSGGSLGKVETLIPGWHVLLQNQPVEQAYLNALPPIIGVSIFDTRAPAIFGGSWQVPIEGQYCLLLENPGYEPDADIFSPELSIVQTGEVPTDYLIIHFTAMSWPVKLKLNGEEVPIDYEPRSGQPGVYDAWVFDVPGQAGIPLQMEFISISGHDIEGLVFGIDSIEFVVPEPGTLSLAAAALLASGCWWVKIRLSRC